MKALKYKIKVVTDIAHGWSEDVDEIYISRFKIYFNSKGYVFSQDEGDRMKTATDIKEIEINDIMAEKLNNLCMLQEEKDKIVGQYF